MLLWVSHSKQLRRAAIRWHALVLPGEPAQASRGTALAAPAYSGKAVRVLLICGPRGLSYGPG